MKIVPINEENREGFYRLMEEYLPGSEPEQVKSLEKEYGGAYLAVMEEGSVVGVAFGWPRRLADPSDSSFTLDGIAVCEAFQKRGYGAQLLTAFVEAAKEYGCDSVSVGSAGGYVEKFYRDNGFTPECYKVYTEEGIRVERYFSSLEEALGYERKDPNGFLVLRRIFR